MDQNNIGYQYDLDFNAPLPEELKQDLNPAITETLQTRQEEVQKILENFENNNHFFQTKFFQFSSNWVDKDEAWENHVFYLNVLSWDGVCFELQLQINQYWKIQWYVKEELIQARREEMNPMQVKLDSVKLMSWLNNDTSERKKFVSNLFEKNSISSKKIIRTEKKDKVPEPEQAFYLGTIDKIKKVQYLKYPGNISENSATVHIKIWDTLFRVSKLNFKIIKPDPRDPEDTNYKIFIKHGKSTGKNEKWYRVMYYNKADQRWRKVDEHHFWELEFDIMESVQHVLINPNFNKYL